MRETLLETPSTPAISMWQRTAGISRVVVTVCLLSWLLLQVDLSKTLGLLQRVHPGYVLLVFVLFVSLGGMGALRWQLLLRSFHIRVAFKEICTITFISSFLGSFLPSGMGGDAVKVYYVAKLIGRPGELVLSVLIERCIGILALLGIPLLVVLFYTPANQLHEAARALYATASALCVCGVALAFLLKRNPSARIRKKAVERFTAVFPGVSDLRTGWSLGKSPFFQVLAISAMSHLFYIAIYYALGTALGEKGRLLDFLYFIPLISLAALLPFSIGGLGIREWTFLYIFTRLGMPRQTALSISLLSLLIGTSASLIGAALYLARGKTGNG